MVRSSFSVVATSCRCGTLASATGSATSSAAQSSGSAAFLAPAMATSPFEPAAAADQEFVHGVPGLARICPRGARQRCVLPRVKG
jgi:hypothetical protein